MSAYCLFDNLVVKDTTKLEEYKSRVLPVVEQFHGKYLVIGGSTQVIEGDWKPVYLVMLEFPTLALAQQWYYSDAYQELKALRLSATESNGAIIEGF